MAALKRILESPITLILLILLSTFGHAPILAADTSAVTPSFQMSQLWLPALILGIGIALILVEVFVLPGFGVAGVSGIIATCVGLFLGIHTIVAHHGTFSDVMGYLISACGTVVAATFIGCMFFYVLPRTPGFRAMLPRDDAPGALKGEALAPLSHITGQQGIAQTPLKPGGKIALENGQVVDVVTRGEFLEAGTQVYVTKVEGPSVVVTKLM